MRQRRHVFVTVGLVLLLIAIAGAAMIRRGFGAPSEPSAMESFLARKARALAVPSKAKTIATRCPTPLRTCAREWNISQITARRAIQTTAPATQNWEEARIPSPRTCALVIRKRMGDGETYAPPFGSVPGDHAGHKYTVITVGHIRGFLDEYIERNWYELRQAGSKDPMFQTLLLLRKSRAASTGRDH
jgi:hypothetical protein